MPPAGRSAHEVRARQLERPQAGGRVLETNAFYKERLQPVASWQDFERLPLTTKDEIMADQLAHPSFGTNLTYPIERYTRLHQTSGTSGSQPLRWLDRRRHGIGGFGSGPSMSSAQPGFAKTTGSSSPSPSRRLLVSGRPSKAPSGRARMIDVANTR